jgi:hypothetical protein
MEKNFYKNLKFFLKDLIIVFPEDDEAIQMVTTSINLAIIDDDDNAIIKKFYESMSPLENLILTKNNQIFQTDPNEYWPPSSYESKLFVKINANWETFSSHNKNTLWEYIQVLYMLSKQITNKM